jgi:dienelactone hydrolase
VNSPCRKNLRRFSSKRAERVVRPAVPSAVSRSTSRSLGPWASVIGSASASIRLFIGLFVLSLTGLTLAQTPQVAQAPPQIVFDDWKKVAEAEDFIEYSLSYPSPVVTQFPENNTVPLRIYLPVQRSGPIPVVLLLHYLGATDLKVERSVTAELVKRGVASVIVALPYHLGRTPPGFFSGELAIQPDPEKLVTTMTQSVLDVRRAVDWIYSRPEFDQARVGIGGTSLGAIVATLAYALEERFARATFMLAGVDLAHIMWHSSRVVSQRDELRSKGFTESRLREALKEIEPLTYLSNRRKDVVFVVGARHDTVIPPVDTEKLIHALGEPKVLWLDTGHYGGAFVQRKLLRTVATFFGDEFSGKSFDPPKALHAPTIRVGLDINPVTGGQVGVGLDLWRSNANADAFASLMLTPKGAQVFIGRRIDRGFAAGITLLSRGVTVGAFWSAVL